MKKLPTLFAFLFLARCSLAPPLASVADRPNILFIIIESLRADHVGCYGYDRPTTPTLDRLAAEGIRFQLAIASSSWTAPCVMSIFTSLSPSAHHVLTSLQPLPDEITTLALELKKGAYQTAGITANPLANSKFGFDRGFDFYDDSTIVFNAQLDLLDAAKSDIQKTPTGADVTEQAILWLDSRRKPGQPFFLFLFYFDPHYDYRPPIPYDTLFTDPEYRGARKGNNIIGLRGKTLSVADQKHIAALYDGEIRYTDDQIEAVLDELKSRGLYTNTLIAVVGDHGEEFWDHGGVAHGHSLYDEAIRVPLILKLPGDSSRNLVVSNQVTQLDIMPSLLDWAALPVPSQCEGRSLRPLCRLHPDSWPPRHAFSETERYGDLKSIRSDTCKLIEINPGPGCECYDLANDPREQHNLTPSNHPHSFDSLNKSLQNWKKRFPSTRINKPRSAIELDPKLLQQLRTLGYVH